MLVDKHLLLNYEKCAMALLGIITEGLSDHYCTCYIYIPRQSLYHFIVQDGGLSSILSSGRILFIWQNTKYAGECFYQSFLFMTNGKLLNVYISKKVTNSQEKPGLIATPYTTYASNFKREKLFVTITWKS